MEEPDESMPHQSNTAALGCTVKENYFQFSLLKIFGIFQDSIPSSNGNSLSIRIQISHKSGMEPGIHVDHVPVSNLELNAATYPNEPNILEKKF
jgi:hypothetical protein